MTKLLADVALPTVGRTLTYGVPAVHAARVVPGARVLVPLGSRRVIGVVLDKREGEPPPKVRDVLRAPDESPSVPTELLDFLRELAAYYLAPSGAVLRMALPPLEQDLANEQVVQPTLFDASGKGVGSRKVQWVEPDMGAPPEKLSAGGRALLERVRAVGSVPLSRLGETWRSARSIVKRLAAAGAVRVVVRAAPERAFFRDEAERDTPPELTAPQRAAVDAIEATLVSATPKTFVLHGVTGSGKTEVYLHAIALARSAKRGVIVLVPEIALTPQLVARYRARFGDDVAVIHSHLTPKERHTMWHKLRTGKLSPPSPSGRGARSSRRCTRSGSSLVDEEHDHSFKQEEGVAVTTRATWPSCARIARARCACSAARRRHSRASTSRGPAARRSCVSRGARAIRRCPR